MSEPTAKSEAVKRAMRGNEGAYYWDIAAALEAEGWKYDPPKPVLPVVSEAAEKAFGDRLGWSLNTSERFKDALQAAFKVMVADNMRRTGWVPRTALHLLASDIYQRLTGEEWT